MADSSSIETRSKKKKGSSNSKKKTEEVVKPTSPPADTGQDEAKTDTHARSSGSPDPNCSICLGKLENKSFTDSCFHMFCFVCLLEWSKVKNECPLCKQSFKSIIHNVRSYEDYDQYHLIISRPRSPEHPYSRNFRYRTTLTEDRVFNLRNRVIGNPVTDPETVLQLQAIGAPTNYPVQAYEMARQNWNRRRQASTSDFRRRIYTNGMRLTGIRGANNRVRECSPAFFTRNPALTHRLVPWLNRELNALLHDEELHVQFLLELIMGLVKRFDIGSEDFYQHVSPFIGRHTRQFMQEFESFAKCPYCMVVYDKKAMYEHVAESVSSDSSTINSVSDDDSDVQFISSEAAPANERTSEYINLPDISSEIQVTSTVDSPRNQNFLQNAGWMSPTPGPSWGFEPIMPPSRQKSFIPSLKRSVGASDTEVDSSADSLSSAGSDVQVVAYDKPWEERSPINLSSETEIERPVKEKKLKEKKKKKRSRKSKESNNIMPSISADHQSSLLFSQSASFTIDGPSTSSTHRRKKHKSRSWRDSHYRNRANILFHRRSTSPEMSDTGRQKTSAEGFTDYDSHRVKRKRKHKHSNQEIEVPSTSVVDLPSSSHTVPSTSHGHSAEKRKKRENRSPSVEIVSIHKKKKKHKKHKHKHSSHKHSKLKSSVVVVGNTEQASQEDTDAYEDESVTSVPTSSATSSAHTSETSGSARSFIDVVSGVCDTLNPVEIASSIAKRGEAPVAAEGDSQLAGVLDLTSVNLEKVHDDVLKESLELETPSSTTSKSCKKHPTGHKKSRTTEHSTSQSLPTPMSSMNQSFLPSFSSVMMRGDPLMGPVSRNDSLALYSNVLQSFQHAFLSDYNPQTWHCRPAFPLRASDPKYYNSWLRNSSSFTSMHFPPLSSFNSNEIVDVDALPLDLRQGHDETNKFHGRSSSRSGGLKPSTVTSSQTTSISSDESVILSPPLDIVTVDESYPSNFAINQSNSSIPVISVSGTEDSSSDSNVVDSTDGKLDISDLTGHNNENSDLNVFGDSYRKVKNRKPSEDYSYRILKEQSIPTSSGLSTEIDLVGGDSSDSTVIHGQVEEGEEEWDIEPDVEISDKCSDMSVNKQLVETEPASLLPSMNNVKQSNISSDDPRESNSVCVTTEPINVSLNCDLQSSTSGEILPPSNVNSLDKEIVVPNSQVGGLEEPSSEAVNLFTSLPCSKMLEDCSSSVDRTHSVNDVNTCIEKVADSINLPPGECDSVNPSSSSEHNNFWKKRHENQLVNSEWRNEESSNETEDSESSSTDSYDYDSFK